MFTFDLSSRFLDSQETTVFEEFLALHSLDSSIWPVFETFFRATVPGTTPLVLRVHEARRLCGAAILVRCNRYGRSLFDNQVLAGLMNTIGLPVHLWVKFGCCMDMLSNPGFVADPAQAVAVQAAMVQDLRQRCMAVVIYDYDHHANHHTGASVLPSMPHALIDTSGMTAIQDYLSQHKNMKRKMNIFRNNGGTFEVVRNRMDPNDLGSVRRCFVATAEQSTTYLPYQDLYLSAALKTSGTHLDNVYYFVARLNGEFLGYQAALTTGTCLNALHGAFDRDRKTTYHAYDLLFIQMVEFAIAHGLKSIDFGSINNTTKQRAINKSIAMSDFVYSKYPAGQWLVNELLRRSKVQGEDQLRYRAQTMSQSDTEVD